MTTAFRPRQRRQSPHDTRTFARRGRWFQDQIDTACLHHRLGGRALIWPIPVPMRVIHATSARGGSKPAFFERKSLPDYLGFLGSGRGVAFDCKSTTGDTWRAAIPTHQIDTLALVASIGHLAGFMIGYAGVRGEPPTAVWIPWPAATQLAQHGGWTYQHSLTLPGALAIPWRGTFDFLPVLEVSAAALPPLTIGGTV